MALAKECLVVVAGMDSGAVHMNAAKPATDPPVIELWFAFSSIYSYPAVMRIEALAASRGVLVRWRPVLLGPVFQAIGWESSPLMAYEAKARYVWRDIERRCVRHGIPWSQPSVFPRRALLPMRIATLAANEPWIGEFCRKVMMANFAFDRDIDDPKTISELLAELALPAEKICSAAVSDANRRRLRDHTDEAIRRGVFGAPTMFVDQEMFWGDDRVDDALDWALASASR